MSALLELHNSTPSSSEREAMTFILPGIDDDLRVWRPLQALLDPIIVEYLDWTELLDSDLTLLTDHIIRQIEHAQPSGDIHLVGYSIGGSLGFAVNLALKAAGRRVSHLVLVDANAESYARQSSLGQRVRERIEQLARLLSLDGMSSLAAKIMNMPPMLPLLRSFVRMRHRKLPLGFDQYLHRKLTIQLMRQLYWPWWHAILHSGHSLATPTILFRSDDHGPFESEHLGWGQLCTKLTVIPIAASHTTIVNSVHMATIRTELETALKAASCNHSL